MAFNNDVNANQQGTQYLSTVGAWTGVDGGTAGHILTSNGTGVAPSFQINSPAGVFTSINNQIFTSSGTYTPTSGMVECYIQILGGGGGGGGAVITGAATSSVGGGGGGGEYAAGIFSAASIGASQAITIGAAGAANSGAAGGSGGTTSVGALITAFGGGGGSTTAALSSAASTPVYGGSGGSGGDYRTRGYQGTYGYTSVPASFNFVGAGANSQFGAGGLANAALSPNAAGLTGYGYGSGGSGAFNGINQGATLAGGTGTPGIVIITEYIS